MHWLWSPRSRRHVTAGRRTLYGARDLLNPGTSDLRKADLRGRSSDIVDSLEPSLLSADSCLPIGNTGRQLNRQPSVVSFIILSAP